VILWLLFEEIFVRKDGFVFHVGIEMNLMGV